MSYQLVFEGTNGRKVTSMTTFETERLAESRQEFYMNLLIRMGYFVEVKSVKIEEVHE